jgi:hypothetical protein
MAAKRGEGLKISIALVQGAAVWANSPNVTKFVVAVEMKNILFRGRQLLG